MPLCFIEPQDAIRVIAESVGREARRQLLGELVRAWVDEIPEEELASHYAKAVDDLDEHDLSMLAAWHASLEVGHADRQQGLPGQRLRGAGREPARGAEDRRGAARGGRVQRGRRGGAGARDGPALAVAAPVRGAGRGMPRALHVGPARLRQLRRAAAAAGGSRGSGGRCPSDRRAAVTGARRVSPSARSASSSAIACPVLSKRTPAKPSSAAAAHVDRDVVDERALARRRARGARARCA